MRGRRKRGDSKRVEYTYDDRYLDAYLKVWRWQKMQERSAMVDEIRMIEKLMKIYGHKPTTNRIQHPGPRSPAG
jgi:hypothetical protein